MQAQKLDCNSKNDRDMIVEVIKGVEHSIELNFGESSVCITPDEAQKLIGQLRAVLPAPSDVEEAARGYATAHIKRAEWVPMDVAFLDGAKWKEGQLMKDAVEVTVYYNFENRLAVTAQLPEDSPHKFCDKVKLIILK